MTDVLNAVDTIRAAADGYLEAEAYYRGEVEELFASPAIERLLAESGSGFRVNLARRPVDAVLDRIRISSVRVPDDDKLTEVLNERVWDRNRLARISTLVHRGALAAGDGYLFVWPSEDGNDVDVFYNSAVSTRAFYDPEHPSRLLYVAKVWTTKVDNKEVVRVTLYYGDRIEKWASKPGTKANQESDFEPFETDDEQWPIDNPYGRPPFFHFRADEPYGRPEHRDAYGPQNAINKLTATQMATTDFQGFPQRWAITETGSGGDMSAYPDDDDAAPTGTAALDTGPGRVWTFPNGMKVGQFDAADVRQFLDPISLYVRLMAASTATPLRFFDPAGQIPSGEALRADDAPLVERIQDRAAWFTDEWRATLVFAMRILGFDIPTVDVQWRPVKIVDDETGWRTVRAKIDAGVPVPQALAETGYRADVIEEWTAGSEQANLETRIGNLARIGDAMQKLGAAVQLGALDKGQVDTLLQQVLGEMVRDE